MNEMNSMFLEYELAYRVERLKGLTAPRRAEHPSPATARFLRGRRTTRTTR